MIYKIIKVTLTILLLLSVALLISTCMPPAFAEQFKGKVSTKSTQTTEQASPLKSDKLFNYRRMDIESYSHFAQIGIFCAETLTVIFLFIGGGWGIYNFYRTRQLKSAEWLHDLFQQFQLKEEFSNGKLYIRYEYIKITEPVLAKMIIHGDNSLKEDIDKNKDQREQALQIDRVLNILEHVLYLQSEKHITERGRNTYFEFWFKLIIRPDFGILRRYMVNFNYDLLSKFTKSSKDEYIVFYEQPHEDLDCNENLEFIGLCNVNGKLCNYGMSPHIVLETGTETDIISVYLYRITSSLLRKVDDYEKKFNCIPTTTRILQCKTNSSDKMLPLKLPVDAWVYTNRLLYNDKADLTTQCAIK